MTTQLNAATSQNVRPAKMTTAELKNKVLQSYQYKAAQALNKESYGKYLNEAIKQAYDVLQILQSVDFAIEVTKFEANNENLAAINCIYEVQSGFGSFKFTLAQEFWGLLDLFGYYEPVQIEPEKTLIETVILNDADLLHLKNAVDFCGKDELRANLTGVFLGQTEGKQMIAGCDAWKLYFAPFSQNLESGYILPVPFVKSITKHKEPVILSFYSYVDKWNDKQYKAIAEIPGGKVESDLINEKYPNFLAVIPTKPGQKIDFATDYGTQKAQSWNKKSGLESVIKQANLYASRTTHQLKLTCIETEAEITALDIDMCNESKLSAPIQSNAAEPVEIGFNGKFWLACLKPFAKSESVTMEYLAANRPAIWSSEGHDGKCLLMSMMLNDYSA
jgi:hypothetical protein